MKSKDKIRTFNIRLNQKEYDIIRQLKNKHGINISGLTKLLLKQKLEQLEQLESNV